MAILISPKIVRRNKTTTGDMVQVGRVVADGTHKSPVEITRSGWDGTRRDRKRIRRDGTRLMVCLCDGGQEWRIVFWKR